MTIASGQEIGQYLEFKQWGIADKKNNYSGADNGGLKLSVKFPLAFNQDVLYAGSSINHEGYPKYTNTVSDVSTTGMLIGASFTDMYYYWISIGV